MQKGIKIFIVVCCLICISGWIYVFTAKISGKTRAELMFERLESSIKTALLKRRNAPSSAAQRFILLPGLIKAIKENNIKKVRAFLTAGATADAFANATSNAPIFVAVSQNNPEILALLLEYGANPYRVDENGRTPAHAAIPQYRQSQEDIDKGIEILKLLFANGVNIDQRDVSGQTLLMHAARSNKLRTISFLIENGADINAKDNTDSTALEIARQFEFDESAALLDSTLPQNASQRQDANDGD